MALDDLSEIQQAEIALKEAENRPDDVKNDLVIAERMEKLAKLIRKLSTRPLDAANMDARAKVIRGRISPEKLVQHKVSKIKDFIIKRLESGQPVSVFCSVPLNVDSELLDEVLNPEFNIEPLFLLGLKGWDVVATVPKTIGVGLKNTSIGSSMGTTWGGGIGGNVDGVYVIVRRTLSLGDVGKLDETLVTYAITQQVLSGSENVHQACSE